MFTRERVALGLLLASIFAVRAIHLDQPIVENYVGRQIPTAMVARNLERGLGFFQPQLDTAPLPNLFLVEPPIYAQLVASFRPILGLSLEPAGRIISALATTFGAWGLFGLVRRREGTAIALVALASFGIFPVMIRYGRAFQPDALMVGCVLGGLRGWDEYEASGNRRWAVFGGFVLAIGLAVKVTSAWTLLPFVLLVRRRPLAWRLVIAAAMLGPALAWYLHVGNEVGQTGPGSAAASDSLAIWFDSLFSLSAWLRFSTYESIGWGLVVSSFTPVGFVLAAYGLLSAGRLDRFWLGWAIGSALAIVGLSSKWHHAYYWMGVAPLAAVGVGRGLMEVASWARFGRPLAVALGSFLLGACVIQSFSTFRTPVEWQALNEAIPRLREVNEVEQRIVASEAVLYYADLKGYRLEFDPAAKKRAAGEWKVDLKHPELPLSLVEFYREADRIGFLDETKALELRGRPRLASVNHVLIVADVGSVTNEPRRRAWREAIRKRKNTKILADEPGYLIAELRG